LRALFWRSRRNSKKHRALIDVEGCELEIEVLKYLTSDQGDRDYFSDALVDALALLSLAAAVA
jgi:hypothetical protein